MKNKIGMLFLSMLLALACMGAFSLLKSQSKPAIEILTKQDAGIKDFYIKNREVHIAAGITVKNNTDDHISFMLTAESQSDYESGLITSPLLLGYDEDFSATVFNLQGKETKTFDVIFVGEHGDFNQKADRLIPQISATVVEN